MMTPRWLDWLLVGVLAAMLVGGFAYLLTFDPLLTGGS